MRPSVAVQCGSEARRTRQLGNVRGGMAGVCLLSQRGRTCREAEREVSGAVCSEAQSAVTGRGRTREEAVRRVQRTNRAVPGGGVRGGGGRERVRGKEAMHAKRANWVSGVHAPQ